MDKQQLIEDVLTLIQERLTEMYGNAEIGSDDTDDLMNWTETIRTLNK
jgi:hypothetical protein